MWTLPVWRRAAGFLRACEDFAFIKIMTWIIAQYRHYTIDK